MNFDQSVLDVLFDHLPKQLILQRYGAGRGKELSSGKFTNPASSSALVANVFGIFLEEPRRFALPPKIAHYGTPIAIQIEQELRFPWRGGLHPWLDVTVETETHLIGIESKRYEPFRDKKSLFSEAFQRHVWGDDMRQFELLRDDLKRGFLHLDPVQLTKHAFALRTQAVKRSKIGVLVYLYAEPTAFPDGRTVLPDALNQHRAEVARFAKAVDGAEVCFHAMTYRQLLDWWIADGDDGIKDHAASIDRHYRLG